MARKTVKIYHSPRSHVALPLLLMHSECLQDRRNHCNEKNRAASVFRRASARSFEAERFLFRLLFSWSLYAFFILAGQHAIPLVECLAECRLRCVARHGDDRFEWQVSCVHEVCGSLHTPSLDILHRWFSHYRLEALGKGGTREVHLSRQTLNGPQRCWVRVNGLQCGCNGRVCQST